MRSLLMTTLAAVLLTPCFQGFAAPKGSGSSSETAHAVSQGEFASWLANQLNLDKSLPKNASILDTFALLAHNGIAPADGWSITSTLSVEALARVVVQSLRKEDAIASPPDDDACVRYLKSIGIDIGKSCNGKAADWNDVWKAFRNDSHHPPHLTPT